jgi:CspA family cold shock protein
LEKGKVKWFNNKKGYGFISLDDGSEVFVHHSCIDGEGFRTLEDGQEVELEVSDTPKGKQASKVVKL